MDRVEVRVGIPVYDKVDLLDVAGPLEFFTWADLSVELVASTPGLVATRTGLQLATTQTFTEAPAYDVLWVPGGDPDALAMLIDDPKRTYLAFLIEQSKSARFVCSVCEGAMLLAAAGLLDGYQATTHWQFIPCFEKYFPKVQVVPGYPRFVVDKNRLTGGGISSGLDEALELIRMIKGEKIAVDVQQTTQYFPNPPVHGSIPGAKSCPLTLSRTR